ncbi:hypothetical protein ACFP63_08850 [Oerskovia jenensis]|uniref:Uncharacterized protein n=1 Tax=Oerskovia jenensis TaxID=162169 RepID=A0ABS2LIF7_9CELL|nr:hypothetical protein [Oerskovia jenensis]MBM7480162.1 hypothetical protein [Oerskovia jenensis]
MFGFLKRRRPAPLPVQALAAIVDQDPAPEYSALDHADGLPRRVSELHFGAGATAATEDEAIVMALGALEQHGPREAAAVLEGFVSVRECVADVTAVPDTGLLGSLLADADARQKGITSSLATEVMVTPDGGLVHGNLTGGAA